MNERYGYMVIAGSRVFFLETDAKRKSKNVIDSLIRKIGEYRNFCEDTINRCLADEATRKDIAYRTSACKCVDTQDGWFDITGDTFHLPFEASDDKLIFLN